MALVASHPLPNDPAPCGIDIIGVPAIGADPKKTWVTNDKQWLGQWLHEEIPNSRVLLYDHLTPVERSAEVKPLTETNRAAHEKSVEEYASTREGVANLDIEGWAERFMEIIRQCRIGDPNRPLVFVAHSTGGIVLKNALNRRFAESGAGLAALCIAIVFFATPHHGSSLIAGEEFVRPFKYKLGLKFSMSEHLRKQFSIRNHDLEQINHKFGAASFGVRIWNFIEDTDTKLDVLTADEFGAESLTPINRRIVDESSAIMETEDVLVEEEEVRPLDTDHVGTARFGNNEEDLNEFQKELKDFITSTSPQRRASHHNLTTSIMNKVLVDIHQFYQTDISTDEVVMRVWSEKPTLQKLLDLGPRKCLSKRLRPESHENPIMNGGLNGSPIGGLKGSDILRRASVPTMSITPEAPHIEITRPNILKATVMGSSIDGQMVNNEAGALFAPTVVITKTAHPPRLPNISTSSNPDTVSHLNPGSALSQPLLRSHLGNKPEQSATRNPRPERGPQRPRTYQAPNRDRDRFMWIHVPYTVAGWVPQILSTISQEKGHLDLHKQLMSRQLWASHHNRSKHASSHARFVRSHCTQLLPKGAAPSSEHGPLSPRSATDHVQFALCLPYLHWDTFHHLQMRAAVISRRSRQSHACPIDPEIVSSKSLESKLIWQYLNTKWSIHPRRTLDQYGYPTLRSTAVRDNDQVLWKQTSKVHVDDQESGRGSSMHNIRNILHAVRGPRQRKSKVKTVAESAATVLMVDQLWLWILDDETVVSFACPKEKDDDDTGRYKEADIRESIYNDINGEFVLQCRDNFDFAALAVYHIAKALLEENNDHHPNLQVFRIFEEYISELTEQQTTSFKEFRDNHRYRDPADLDVHNLPRYVDNRGDLDALLELRDIEDELTTVKKLFEEQETTVQEMMTHYKYLTHQYGKGMHGIRFLGLATQLIHTYQHQVDSMLNSTKVAQAAYEKLLDMKQKQANIIEAHLAREQTQVAAEQSRSVMIFTVFTIIFLPLSFFASVFGMNIQEWSSVSTNISMHNAFTYMGAISLAVIVFALLVAFNRFTRRAVRSLWRIVAKPVMSILDRVPSRRVHALAHYRDVESASAAFPNRSESAGTRASPRRATSSMFEMEFFSQDTARA